MRASAMTACSIVIFAALVCGCATVSTTDRIPQNSPKGYAEFYAANGNSLGISIAIYERQGTVYLTDGSLEYMSRLKVACTPGEHAFFVQAQNWSSQPFGGNQRRIKKDDFPSDTVALFVKAGPLMNVTPVVVRVQQGMITPVRVTLKEISRTSSGAMVTTRFTLTCDLEAPKAITPDSGGTPCRDASLPSDASGASLSDAMATAGIASIKADPAQAPDDKLAFVMTPVALLSAECSSSGIGRGEFEEKVTTILKDNGVDSVIITYADGTTKRVTQTSAMLIHASRALAPAPRRQPTGWENSLGMIFVPIQNVEGVTFCVWETRNKDFRAYEPAHNSGKDQDDDNQPAVLVSWNDATAFCEWLTNKERKAGIIREDQTYRLPTDIEWSMALGLGEERGDTPEARDDRIRPVVYPWGTQWPPPAGAGNFRGSESYVSPRYYIKDYQDDYVFTAPVGSFDPNSFGLYDMSGNVSEWCVDFYNGASGKRVRRDASWVCVFEGNMRSDGRNKMSADAHSVDVGFRIVLQSSRGNGPGK